MILSALNDYYQRLLDTEDSGIAPPGYSQEKIGFVIVLSDSGEAVDVVDLRTRDGKKLLPRTLSVPQGAKRTVGIKSNFLWDKTSYVLGVSLTSKRSDQEHAAFGELHRQALAGTEDAGMLALLHFLERWTPEHFSQNPHFLPKHGEELYDANLVFRLDGARGFLHESPAARASWAQQQGAVRAAAAGTCLVTGMHAPIARLHPSIKGVNGAQSSGASIVSFNLESFTSYGKIQGENAPVSEQAAFGYTTALNHLLRRDTGNRQRVQIGDTTVVFWAQAPDKAAAGEAEGLIADFIAQEDKDEQATQRLNEVLQQVRQSRPLRDLEGHLEDGTQIYVLGLAPNASRLSIRFWETGSLRTFAERLTKHYDDLELRPSAWKRAPTPRALALTTAPLHGDFPKNDDVSPLLAGELTRAILTGQRYPYSLLGNLVMRFRADGEITPLRVALCKAVLVRDARLKSADNHLGEKLVSLDLTNTDPGYLLGRLFSTLENVQRAALGTQINATIRDRYYGAASATPASIFPVLLRNAQNHLSRLRKEKAGLAVTLEKEVGQIVNALPITLPRSLGIEAQGRFAIGYYHQIQARFAKADAHDIPDTESTGASA
ncbi:type I-C CRISPR-associated protein Cas8c/Csd1 [Solimonas soli]|uniref:type I-C CRISPR-associated protein Cas8c/Csd1 n=1 Tax=Solimonas soli TaxID=413479 RepID=UPI000489BECB|nr:type I-C CRISPR-associated protein Cas8c/Csd1 [Solimonas soli]